MSEKQQPAYLTIRVEGPEIRPGRMRLSAFVELAQELMRAVERTATVLQTSGESARPGRPPDELKKSVSLDLVGFAHGSPAAVAYLERSDSQIQAEETDLGDQAYRAFLNGFNSVVGEEEALPLGYDLGVLLKIRDIGKAFSHGVGVIDFTLNHRERPIRTVYRPEGLGRVRKRIERPEAQEITLQGRLLMADFKETGRQIRIHPPTGQAVPCRFGEELSDEVEENIRAYVRVRGQAKYSERGEISSIDLSDLEPLDEGSESNVELPVCFGNFWEHKTVEELAVEQGVGPVTDLSAILGTWPGEMDDGFEAFVEEMRSNQPVP